MAMGDRLRHIHLTDGTVAMGEGGVLNDERLAMLRETRDFAVAQLSAGKRAKKNRTARVN